MFLIAAVRAIMDEPGSVNSNKPKYAEKGQAHNSCQSFAIYIIECRIAIYASGYTHEVKAQRVNWT